MDWTTVAAALVGGGIGIIAELVGRRSARSQAREERLADREERVLEEERNLRSARAGEIRQAGRDAAIRIIESVRENNVPLRDRPGGEIDESEIAERVWRMWSALYVDGMLIDDSTLRARIATCEKIFDVLLTPEADLGMPARMVVRVVRVNLYAWLGAWVRGEELPPISQDFEDLSRASRRAVETWHEWLETHGSA